MKRVMAICRLIVVMGGKHVRDSLLKMHNELKQSFLLSRIPRCFLFFFFYLFIYFFFNFILFLNFT